MEVSVVRTRFPDRKPTRERSAGVLDVGGDGLVSG